ncbi:MAG: hypothetical protein Q8P54_02410, partial [bacterium]|nr:hypothetical protein [bacterium]
LMNRQKGYLAIAIIIVLAITASAAIFAIYTANKSKQEAESKKQLENKLIKVIYSTKNPSLGPQYNQDAPITYEDTDSLNTISDLLKKYDISQIEEIKAAGCVGGTNYQYDLTYANSKAVNYAEYKCGGNFYGNMGGDVAGFVKDFSDKLQR